MLKWGVLRDRKNGYEQTISKLLFITMLAAQAVVISFYEHFIPTPFAFAPGTKLGLANLITVLALFTLKPIDSAKVILLKLSISTFLSGTFSTFLYGFQGHF